MVGAGLQGSLVGDTDGGRTTIDPLRRMLRTESEGELSTWRSNLSGASSLRSHQSSLRSHRSSLMSHRSHRSSSRRRGGKRGAKDEDARSESDGSELGREPFTEDEMLSELDEMLDAFGSDVAGDDGAAALAPPRPPSPRQLKLSDLSVRELNEC
jgi:hypothetical protein